MLHYYHCRLLYLTVNNMKIFSYAHKNRNKIFKNIPKSKHGILIFFCKIARTIFLRNRFIMDYQLNLKCLINLKAKNAIFSISDKKSMKYTMKSILMISDLCIFFSKIPILCLAEASTLFQSFYSLTRQIFHINLFIAFQCGIFIQ